MNRHSQTFAPVIGKRSVLSTQPTTGGFSVQPTQLISHREPSGPRQWLITVMQPVMGSSGVNPWVSTFDAGIYPPVLPAIFTAPNLPDAQGLQLFIRWGAGGFAFETRADYPAAGGAFSLAAETVDVNVGFRGTGGVYASLPAVPVVGAFMVAGSSPEPCPLRWLDRPSGPLSTAGVAAAYWAVKPFSRRCRISLTGAAAASVDVAMLDTANATLWVQRVSGPAVVDINVVGQATLLSVTNNTAGVIGVNIEWAIGLA